MVARSLLASASVAKPFLKWAGGKRWLVEHYPELFPKFEGTYFEPFLGGGSVFFHLSPVSAFLSDSNYRLIECYRQIRDHYSDVLYALEIHHNLHSDEYYYRIRSYEFECEIERAAQFLYLNRTCFNGLYRVNNRGAFNVPIGSKDKIFDPNEDFACISKLLASADLVHADFETVVDRSREGDFVFVDPPYTVKHNNNGFVKYNENIFRWSDQVRLRDAIVRAAKRGASILISNAAHSSVIDLYKDIGIHRIINRFSVISGNNQGRGNTQELIVSICGTD